QARVDHHRKRASLRRSAPLRRAAAASRARAQGGAGNRAEAACQEGGGTMNVLELQKHLIAFAVLHGGLGDYGIRADGVRDDDGIDGPRTREAFAAFRRVRGGSAGTDELRAAIAETPVGATLGERALAVALREWCAGVREEPPGSNSGPRIREYLAPRSEEHTSE